MNEITEFNLENYLSKGIERLIKSAIKATLKNPKESLFMAKAAISSMNAANTRKSFALKGEHIPPFLIASIAKNCNLHCAGCYARANRSCNDVLSPGLLTLAEWRRIFSESENLGINFILLAGGEPLLRLDILQMASERKNVIFPVFTNGTMIGEEALALFEKERNLIPVVSIEGNEEITDRRRGTGVYKIITQTMNHFMTLGILFGVSITVTKENLNEVTSNVFLQRLTNHGCKIFFYVEYVPVAKDTLPLALEDADREKLASRLQEIRTHSEGTILISFPGDEKSSGGCLAAGRGFFHINAEGSAEPCPFSPHSDTNLKNVTVRECLKSNLFQTIQKNRLLLQEHVGGCVLFEKDEFVKAISNPAK